MRNTILLIMLLLACSCSKKEVTQETNNTTVNNGFTSNSHFFNTENAGFATYDNFVSIIFYSNGVSFNIQEQAWQGTGHAIAFDEITSTGSYNGMPLGNYTLSYPAQAGYFTDAISRMNYNFAANSGYEAFAVSGTLSISRISTNFKITYSVKNSDSSTVTGEFTGIPQDITSWFSGKK